MQVAWVAVVHLPEERVSSVAFRLFVGLLLTLAGLPMAAGQELVFGVYPYLSPTQVVEHYAPLRDHIARTLGRPVSMVSAPDFRSFMERTRSGTYDIVFTAPHMGRLAEKRDGWQRIAKTGYQIQAVMLVRADSDIRKLQDLRSRTVAVGSRESMTYQLAGERLAAEGLALGRDVRVAPSTSFSNVIHAVTRGEVDAGVTSRRLWHLAPEAQRHMVRSLFESSPTPGFFIMAHPRLGDEAIGRLRLALFSYKDTGAGAAFFARTEQVDFRAIDDATMRLIDPFTNVFMEQR